MRSAWRILEADSRSLEISMALIGMAFSVSCWMGRWFGNWLPAAGAYSGLEPIAGAVGLTFNALHLYLIFGGYLKARQAYALTNTFALAGLSCAIFLAHGWSLPAGSVLATGSLINLWIFLSLHTDRVDLSHWRQQR